MDVVTPVPHAWPAGHAEQAAELDRLVALDQYIVEVALPLNSDLALSSTGPVLHDWGMYGSGGNPDAAKALQNVERSTRGF